MANVAFTQNEFDGQRFKGGVILGANLSQIDGDRLAGYNQPGLNAGAAVSAVLTKRWEVGIEFLYSQKGANRTINDQPSSAFSNIRLNYVEAPILVHFHDWKFRVSSGFSYARLLSFKVIDNTGFDTTDLQNLKSGNFTFIIGADYFFRENWGVGVRWSRESDVQQDDGATDFRGRSLSIRTSYYF